MKTPKEIPLKLWIYTEAVKSKLSVGAVWQRYVRGKYPGLKVRKINCRKTMVRI